MGIAPALYDVVVSLVVSGVGENAEAAASCGGTWAKGRKPCVRYCPQIYNIACDFPTLRLKIPRKRAMNRKKVALLGRI